MNSFFKVCGSILILIICFFKADSSEFENIYRDNFCFINDSDKVFTVDVRQLKNARLFRTRYEGEITEPILVHPGRYMCTCFRYLSSNLELGHILLYGTDLIEYEALESVNKNKEGLNHWLVGSLDFIIPENRDRWRMLLNNNSLAQFSVNEKLGLVLQRRHSCGCIIIRLMNMLPEYRYTNRRTPSEYMSSLTGEEYPKEEPEDGDTRPLYLGPILDWQMIKQIYKPEEEEKNGGCCTVQ